MRTAPHVGTYIKNEVDVVFLHEARAAILERLCFLAEAANTVAKSSQAQPYRPVCSRESPRWLGLGRTPERGGARVGGVAGRGRGLIHGPPPSLVGISGPCHPAYIVEARRAQAVLSPIAAAQLGAQRSPTSPRILTPWQD